MWSLGSKIEVLGLKVPTQPPALVGEVRSAYLARIPGPVAFESRFPLANPDGRYLCKSCGIAFDEWNSASAIAAVRETMLDSSGGFCMLYVNCRKCSRYSFFSSKEIVTGRSSDPFGPWSKEELDVARNCLTSVFHFSAVEIASITPQRLHTVLFLYR